MQGSERRGICWSRAGTVGNIAVSASGATLRGDVGRALFACDIAPAGKYRNGAARWWCRTHQGYWGVKADLAAAGPLEAKRCKAAGEPLGFVLDPLVLDMRSFASVRVTASGEGMQVRALPAVACTAIDARFPAIALSGIEGIFASPDIAQVNVTPPALRALLAARAGGRPLGCLGCARCGHPHLDLGDFAHKAHRRHYCGNCGNDSTHSTTAIVSNPLFALGEWFAGRLRFD
ncbi:MAG: hypothetical protein JWR40_3296 [Massilia sp.]|jgi:hypothetical protein|nr:hypothetical protein [Massilia sp.]